MRSGAHILVVEDDPLSRDVLVRLLSSRGFRVDTVTDGPACLETLAADPPDLVLLDISMPGMSGLDVLRVVRRDRNRDQLPVVLVTALVGADDVVAGLEAGANDYVVKPINPPVLLARIGVALRIKHDVARLVEAEKHRVMLEALDGTCEQLAAPMSQVLEELDRMVEDPTIADERTTQRLTEVRDWARQAARLLTKYRKIARYQQVPYTEGLGSFVAASLASTRRHTRSANGDGDASTGPHPEDARGSPAN